MRKYNILIAGLILAISGCHIHEVKQNLGVHKKAPDEFMVITHEKLVVPKDKKLPQPQEPKKYSTNKQPPQQEVKQVLGGKDNHKDDKHDNKKDDKHLMNNIKPGQQDIKQQINKDNKNVKNNIITNKANTKVVDSKKEEERIKELQQQGQPISGEDSKSLDTQEKLRK